MTLKNKDGSVYKLAGPNPAMKEQKLWSDYAVHNMTWKPEHAQDNTVVTPVQSDFHVKDDFLAELDKAKSAIKEEIKVVETRQEPAPEVFERKPIVQPDLHREELQANSDDGIEKVFVHCLPASVRERKDSLYGETYRTIKYGNPYSFEGVVVEQQDLFIKIWTTADNTNEGSILFPKTHQKRWWRVQQREKKSGGWLLAAMPSDHQPSFE